MTGWLVGNIVELSSAAACGGLLLFAGIFLGLILAKRLMRAAPTGLSTDDVLRIVAQFKTVAHDVAEDMSQYREVIDLAQKRFHDLNGDPAAAEETTLQLLSQMAHANELLQRRIEEAELTLSQQSQQMAAALNEARTDTLTKLANRRAFEDEFQRRSAEFRRHGTRFLLMIIDIDHFKQLNDTFGHPAGDAVLARLSALLKQTVRDTDLVARLGGEEFALLLPAGEMDQVTESVERIRLAVAGNTSWLEDRTIRVTVSCGAAEPLPWENSEALIQRADAALYAAKAAGRNRCFFHTGTECIPLTPAESKLETISPAEVIPPVLPEETFRQACNDLRRRLEEVTRR